MTHGKFSRRKEKQQNSGGVEGSADSVLTDVGTPTVIKDWSTVTFDKGAMNKSV